MVKRLIGLLLLMLLLGGTLPARALADTGGYPWAAAKPCSQGCQADEYGFYKRECTSFVAWKLHSTNGLAFHNDFNRDGQLDFGDARQWRAAAERFGLRVDSQPAVGAVAWWASGHVAWVEAVQGSQVTLQEYNFDYQGNYHRRSVTANAVDAYIHFTESPAPYSIGKLAFVKTHNTGSGQVELHHAPAPFQQLHSAVTRFTPADAAQGQLRVSGDKLVLVKTQTPAADKAELHWLSGASTYQSGYSTQLWFSQAEHQRGSFYLQGSDVVFVKTVATANGLVELHRIGEANYQAIPSSFATPFVVTDAINGYFTLLEGQQDLAFIKTNQTGSGRVEVHIADAACGYCRIYSHRSSVFIAADAVNGEFFLQDMTGDGQSDLVFVKIRNTGSGMVEVHIADAMHDFLQLTESFVTVFNPADAVNGQFMITA